MLCSVVLQNVPVLEYNLRPKAVYVSHMLRRVVLANLGKEPLDDKVCVPCGGAAMRWSSWSSWSAWSAWSSSWWWRVCSCVCVVNAFFAFEC